MMMRRTALFIAACLAPVSHIAAQDATPPVFLSEQELRDTYALPNSQFAEIGGETIHFVDEGQGPAILLVHGSYASLRQWDRWAERLKDNFRVVRFDLSPQGLSGPHPANAYSIDHKIETIDTLMDRLGIGRFTIVGTSSSGVPVAAYAAARPDRVQSVILNNIAVGKLDVDYSSLPPEVLAAVAADQKHPGWHEPEYWRQILLLNITNDSVVDEALVQRWTDLNNRPQDIPGMMEAVVASVSALRTPDDLAKISVPTLLLWGQDDHETRLEREGINGFNALTVEDRTLLAIGQCGHMMPMDCPDRSLDAVLPFLLRTAD